MDQWVIRALLGAIVSFALFAPATIARAEEEEKKEEPKSPLTLSGAIDVPSAYFFRGYNIIDTGLLVQPDLKLTWNAYEGKDFSYAPYVEAWANLAEQKSPRSPRHVNEVDLILGNEFTCGDWTFALNYIYYTSPSDAFDDIHELLASVEYAWSIGKVDMHPKLTLAREIQDKAGPEDMYLEAGLTPSFDIPNTKFSIELPLVLGMSPDGTFLDKNGHNETFGFLSAGAVASYPLGEHWSINAGVYYLYLMADSLQASNNGNPNAVWGKVGLTFEY